MIKLHILNNSNRLLKLKLLILLTAHLGIAQVDYSKSVNPFIGTGGHGHTFPGATLPFGMVQLSPDTRNDDSWDGCSGYHYSDSVIYGFSHTHLSGTGVSDWADILITPFNEYNGHDLRKYRSKFDHKNEKAHAGYYAVKLNNGCTAELTSTLRTGIHKYNFPNNKAFISIDLLHRDKTIKCDFKLIDSVTIEGFRTSEAWAKEQYCYFTMKLSKPVKKISLISQRQLLSSATPGRIEGAILEFDNSDKKDLIIKVGLSNVNNGGSKLNLETEAKHWDFEKYKADAESVWNSYLSKIQIKENDNNKRTVFYTALYHCYIHPSTDMDCDGKYRGMDNKIHTAASYTHHNVFSLWDTYRALHPLFTIIEQKRTNDFIKTFIDMYEQSGNLPVWELSSNETGCMIGYHSVSVIADAYLKGIHDYNSAKAIQAMMNATYNTKLGINTFLTKNFLEINDESESVSKSLEYAYDNWCIAQMANAVDKSIKTDLLLKSSQAYRNLYDPSTGFMRPRINGNWYSPFNPTEINNHFTEGNSWQYSFYVPHDINGLVGLHGGKKQFEGKLDELFNTKAKTTGREQADVTGLVGQYAHGNEPSHHAAFLYHYIGKPEKSSKRVRQILNDFYKNSPDGLIGNDDCGQMSAWYILSSIGLYQVCPGNPELVITQPLYNETSINMDNGRSLKIVSNGKANEGISSYNLNGSENLRSYITYDQISGGGKIDLIYTDLKNPQNKFGKSELHCPHSKLEYPNIIPAPIINYQSKTFKSSQPVILKKLNQVNGKVLYTTDGSNPTLLSNIFTNTLSLSSTSRIKCKIYTQNDSSIVSEARIYKIPDNLTVKIKSIPNAQYKAGGPSALIDGIYGDIDWRKGDWQGYQDQDFECVIELKTPLRINSIKSNFLQDTRSWIIFPKEVIYMVSADGVNFKAIDTIPNSINANDYQIKTQSFTGKSSNSENIKFIKVIARNYGKLPEWHMGYGGSAFIFIDEIEVK